LVPAVKMEACSRLIHLRYSLVALAAEPTDGMELGYYP
jgi:hypothetical protein